MAIHIRRRELIVTFVSTMAAWPLAARAQQSAMPVIGVLQAGTPTSYDLSGFRRGLKEAGFVEGLNLAIEYRFANDDPDRLPELASDLVRRRVRVIAAIASALATRAAKAATDTIPIVFGHGLDPVEQGHVASLNHPAGNVTGITSRAGDLFSKQLGILHELLPQATCIGVLGNPKGLQYESFIKDTHAAASVLGLTIEVLNASTDTQIDAIFARLGNEKRVQAILIDNDPLFFSRRVQLAILGARYALPIICPFREMAAAGALLSYGPNLADRDREAGLYVGRILKGENPADLPVQQVSKFELVINLPTARALGLTVPPMLLARADEVIE